jgi:hypothetical protein
MIGVQGVTIGLLLNRDNNDNKTSSQNTAESSRVTSSPTSAPSSTNTIAAPTPEGVQLGSTIAPTTSPMGRGTIAPTPEGVQLEWFGRSAYLKASNVQATILDDTDGSVVTITFQDDSNRPLNINSGGAGEEISREHDWREGGIQRRVKFYFAPKNRDAGSYDWATQALDRGWTLYDARMYNTQGTDWVFWGEDYPDITMVQTPPGVFLFHCDYFEINYRGGGKFVATDVTMGGFLEEGYHIDDLEVFDPCAELYPGKPCRAVDGAVQCGDVPLTLEVF